MVATRRSRRSTTTTPPAQREQNEGAIVVEQTEKDPDDDGDAEVDDVTRPSNSAVKSLDNDEESDDEDDKDEDVSNENDVDDGGDSISAPQDDSSVEGENEEQGTEVNEDDDDDSVAGDGGSTHNNKKGRKKVTPGAKAKTLATSTDGAKASKRKNQNRKKTTLLASTSSTQKKTNSTADNKMSNPLTKLIPGYTAPMMLNTSLLDKYRPKGGILELQKRAERTDASTKDFVLGTATTAKHIAAMKKTSQGFLPTSYTDSYSSFKKGIKRPPDNTAGKGWFGMTPTPMTEELKTDLAVIRNRSYLDPKRFYKSSDKHHKIVQLGTVIEGSSEYYSSRLTKKQRRTNITEEIMADPASADYARNKYKQMSREKTYQAQKRQLKPKSVRKFY
jgi:hypothetical protein